MTINDQTTERNQRLNPNPKNLKSFLEDALRPFPRLYRLGSKVYNALNGRFRSASPGLPEGIHRAFEHAVALEDGAVIGDYYEFGVFRGHSLEAAQRTCDELNLEATRFYGFDSFSGLPAIEGPDMTHDRFFEGQFACSRDSVVRSLRKRGFDWSRATLIEGEFSESLTEELRSRYPFREVVVALFDCDLYSSTIDALTWLEPYITNRSILLFDDWFSFGDDPNLGQQKAFAEFLDSHRGIAATQLWPFAEMGMAYFCRRRPAAKIICPKSDVFRRHDARGAPAIGKTRRT